MMLDTHLFFPTSAHVVIPNVPLELNRSCMHVQEMLRPVCDSGAESCQDPNLASLQMHRQTGASRKVHLANVIGSPGVRVVGSTYLLCYRSLR